MAGSAVAAVPESTPSDSSPSQAVNQFLHSASTGQTESAKFPKQNETTTPQVTVIAEAIIRQNATTLATEFTESKITPSQATAEPNLTGLSQPTRTRANSMTRIVPVSQLENTNAVPVIQPQTGNRPSRSLGQVTSVSQLSDVQPTDWAFQALQSLVERYACIVGYPDSTFRGNRALSRYEFAAGLNACMTRIEELIAATTAPLATKEDLAIVQKLQEEFAAELAGIRGQVDTLEARSAKLEAQQFSTTTKLNGQVIVSAIQNFGPDRKVVPANDGVSPLLEQLRSAGVNADPWFRGPTDKQTTLNQRTTLSLLTSFTGKDLLITSVQAGNYPSLVPNLSGSPDIDGILSGFGVFEGFLGPSINQVATGNNDVGIFYLGYRRPFHKDKGTLFVTAAGGDLSDFTDTLNSLFDDEGGGALSTFGLRNPIYNQARAKGAGIGASYSFNRIVNLSVGYLASSNRSNPTLGTPQNPADPVSGLFNGDYAAIAQLTLRPTKTLGLGLTYIRSYFASNNVAPALSGYAGTQRANYPFCGNPDLFLLAGGRFEVLSTATSADSVGFEFSWRATPRFILGGWVGAAFARAEQDGFSLGLTRGPLVRDVAKGDTATVLNYALTLGFPDLFIKDNLGGIIIGSQPQVVSSSVRRNTDPDTNIHIEAFYKFQLNNYISITPGAFVVINPEGNSNNDPIYVGTIRTTFSF
jgi:hypothetical protein